MAWWRCRFSVQSLRTTPLRRSMQATSTRDGAGSSSGEGSPWAEQEILVGSPAGRTPTITTPPEILASRSGDLRPWSSGGTGSSGSDRNYAAPYALRRDFLSPDHSNAWGHPRRSERGSLLRQWVRVLRYLSGLCVQGKVRYLLQFDAEGGSVRVEHETVVD
jgi:hypothetical protein